MKKILILLLVSIGFFAKAQQTMVWAKAFNGNGIGISCATDALGNVYSAGYFSGTVDFDTGVGVNTVTAVGIDDGYVTKLDVNGNLVWVKTFGGVSADFNFTSIKLDANGNVHLTGSYSSMVDFDPNNTVFNLTSSGGNDFFILKLDNLGALVWAKSLGNSFSGDLGLSIDLDGSGNVYVTGYFNNTIDFDPGVGVFNLTAVAQFDCFILKLSSAGNFVWAKTIGGLYNESGNTIHIDAVGQVCVGGYFSDVVDFDPGGAIYNLTAIGTYGAFVLKLDANGNFVLAKAITSSLGSVDCRAIISDPLGNLYLTGYFAGTVSFDGMFSLVSYGSNDAYVAKLDAQGNFNWTINFGGTAIEAGRSIALDSENNLHITGNFQGTCDFDPSAGTYSLTSAGGDDIYICKFDDSGNFLCAGSMGGVGNEYGWFINVDVNDNVFNTGFYQNTCDFDPAAGVFTLSAVGSNEVFISKYTPFMALPGINNTICDGASITLSVTGASTYSWSPPGGLNTTTSATVIATPSVNTAYTVFAKTGCLRTATPFAINLLAKPVFAAPSVPQNLFCVPDSTLLQSTSSNTNAVLKWRKSVGTVYSNQPFYAKSSGNYFSIAIDTTTGCSDSSLVSVINKQTYPNSKITSHTYTGPTNPVDTVTCYQPTVTLVGASDTIAVNFAWRDIITNSLSANPIDVSIQSNLKLIVTNTVNGCVDSSFIVLVAQNNAPVNYNLSSTTLPLNCSIYTATLNAVTTPSNNVTLWSGPGLVNQSNPQIVSSPGNYTVSSTNTLSGCAGIKTVSVVYSNQLALQSSNDTLVCKNSNLSITSVALGTVTGIIYSWNNGSTNQTTNVNVSNTSTYVVNATGGGCAGIDTVVVSVAPLTNDSVVAYKSCSVPTEGSIVIFANSGIAPFQYSINNGNTFSSNNSFANIPFGTYITSVMDGLGCTKTNTVILNSFSSLPVPKFIASTSNAKADTIVLVDISIPKPDSVQWLLPGNVTKIDGSMFSPVIVVSDTGSFNITMKAFYGNCIISTTKQIKFGEIDTLAANGHNASGIKSVVLYPNPNDGQFTVDVEFYKKQNANVQILSSTGAQQFQQNFYDISLFSLPVNLTQVVNGIYVLRIIGEYDAKCISFVISK